MSDIVERLHKWSISTDAVTASDLMDEAAKEIEWLRQNRNHWMRTAAAFDDHLATLRVMLMEQPGGDKDTPSQQLLAAYQLGVRHRDPPDQVRSGAVEGRDTVQLTNAEREAVEWYAAYGAGDHAAALRALLSRTGTNSRQTCDEAIEFHSHGEKTPERDRLTDAERAALTEASGFYVGTRTGKALSSLLERLGVTEPMTKEKRA